MIYSYHFISVFTTQSFYYQSVFEDSGRRTEKSKKWSQFTFGDVRCLNLWTLSKTALAISKKMSQKILC